jgi:hypothetical protein
MSKAYFLLISFKSVFISLVFLSLSSYCLYIFNYITEDSQSKSIQKVSNHLFQLDPYQLSHKIVKL